MTQCDLGRYCAVCKTYIFDFTHLTDSELINILENTSGEVCGRFRKSQLDRVLVKEDRIESTNPKYHKMLAALLALSATVGVSHATPSVDFTSLSPVTVFSNDSLPIPDKDSPKNIFKGKVTDENGEALIGVSVLIKASTIGVATNIEGNFELAIPESYLQNDSIIIEISYLGYNRKEVNIPLNKISEFYTLTLEQSEVMMLGMVFVKPRFYDPIYGK